MKNITKQKATDPLFGRTKFASKFIDIKDIRGKNLLDIGCGYGWMELVVLQNGIKKCYAMELHSKDLETAKKNISDKRIIFFTGSAIHIPLPDKSVNTVVAWDVIEHIPKGTEATMFSEIRRILVHKGVLYISTPNRSFVATLCDPAWWLIGHRHYKKETLIALAEKSGLQNITCIVKGGCWEVLWLLNLYITKWIFQIKPLYEKWFSSHQDKEYQKTNGWTTIFGKFQKT